MLLFATLATLVCCTGCPRASDTDSGAMATTIQPGELGIGPLKPIEYPALKPDGTPLGFAKSKYPDGTPTHYENGNPTYGPDGMPLDYRISNKMEAMAALPSVYLRADTGEQVVLSGDSCPVRVDPVSKAVCWRAYHCANPKCSGSQGGKQLQLYAPKADGVIVGKSGNPVLPGHADRGDGADPKKPIAAIPAADSSPLVTGDPVTSTKGVEIKMNCPLCGQITPDPYELPEATQQREKLLNEIERLRAEKAEQLQKKKLKE
ncbi:MAG: hypothetical protein K8T91_10265 [Planctomycetes bacterium]|nr:hypothetical protein [Planctomycetota bacterium]